MRAGETAEGTQLLRESADEVRHRLQELRDPELRNAYSGLDEIQRILADGGDS